MLGRLEFCEMHGPFTEGVAMLISIIFKMKCRVDAQ